MTVKTALGEAAVTPGGPAESGSARQAGRPSPPGRMVKYGIWLAVVTRALGDRRFQAGVITRAIGAYALVSLIKNNQARPVRRAAHWYTGLGASKKLDRARQAPEPGKH
jgi:hypothetical protein